MNYFSKNNIENLNRIDRLNLVNSITGVKPTNLIGTIDKDGNHNLAIFSSVVHLGSNPALIACITRPVAEVPRNSYSNIMETGCYTINAVPQNKILNAHYTSSKYPKGVSEFEKCELTPVFKNGFVAPFVQECPIQIGMSLQEVIDIRRNGTKMIIGEIEHLYLEDLPENYVLDLSALKLSGVSGLNTYYKLEKLQEFPFARPSENPFS